MYDKLHDPNEKFDIAGVLMNREEMQKAIKYLDIGISSTCSNEYIASVLNQGTEFEDSRTKKYLEEVSKVASWRHKVRICPPGWEKQIIFDPEEFFKKPTEFLDEENKFVEDYGARALVDGAVVEDTKPFIDALAENMAQDLWQMMLSIPAKADNIEEGEQCMIQKALDRIAAASERTATAVEKLLGGNGVNAKSADVPAPAKKEVAPSAEEKAAASLRMETLEKLNLLGVKYDAKQSTKYLQTLLKKAQADAEKALPPDPNDDFATASAAEEDSSFLDEAELAPTAKPAKKQLAPVSVEQLKATAVKFAELFGTTERAKIFDKYRPATLLALSDEQRAELSEELNDYARKHKK